MIKLDLNNMNVYTGIDPGKTGGIFAFNENGEILVKEAVPMKKGEPDWNKFYAIMKQIRAKSGFKCTVKVSLEDVHSIFGASAKSNFTFGKVVGIKQGLLIASGYEFNLVQPKVWQKAVWIPEDVVLKENGKKDTKATSLNAVKRIFPLVDFKKNSRSRVEHDGIVDAALMAEYTRIINSEI